MQTIEQSWMVYTFRKERRSLVTSKTLLVLSLHRLINCTRNVIWLADTNYRIDLDNETVRSLALADDFDSLLAADQVGIHF